MISEWESDYFSVYNKKAKQFLTKQKSIQEMPNTKQTALGMFELLKGPSGFYKFKRELYFHNSYKFIYFFNILCSKTIPQSTTFKFKMHMENRYQLF